MNIELVRHFKVDHKWIKYMNSKEVDLACDSYNTSDIKNPFVIKNRYQKVYISGFIRTKLTSDYLENREILVKDERLNELTMNPFVKTNIRLHPMVWFTIWQFCWRFNIPLAKETIKDTNERIRTFMDMVEKENVNITIVGHALIFKRVMRELKKRGYNGSFRPKFFNNGEIREFVKI